jgi:hypothetical protein
MVTDTGVVVTPQPVGGAASRSARVLMSAAAGSAEPGPGRIGQKTAQQHHIVTEPRRDGPRCDGSRPAARIGCMASIALLERSACRG